MQHRTTPDCGQVGSRELLRDLGRPQVLAVVIGAMVGTSIYIRPASIAQLAGATTPILIVWVAAGLLTLFGALTYAQLAMRISGAGGEYQFLRATLGALPAFLFGWMRLIIGPAVIAGLAVAFTVFLGDVVPIGSPWVHWNLLWGDRTTHIDFGPRQSIALIVIFGLAWINTRGVRTAGGFQVAVTLCKVIGLLALIGAILLFGHVRAEDSVAPAASAFPTALSSSAAVLAAIAAYNGWTLAAMLGGEIRDPERVLPRALIVGVAVVTILYLAANVAFLQALSLQDIATSNSTAYPTAPSVAGLAVRRVLGASVAAALPILFASSALGAAHCNILAVPRVFYSMARDGLLPRSLARVAGNSGTPNRAIALIATLASVFAVMGSYDRLTNMTAYSYLLFYALTTIGFLWSRRATPRSEWDLRLGRIVMVAALFLFGALWLIVTSVLRGTAEVMLATGLVAMGMPVFVALRLLRSQASPSTAGSGGQ